LTDYLTTDELLDYLAHPTKIVPRVEKDKPLRKIKNQKSKISKKKVFFWVAIVIAMFHIFYVSIPLLSENRGVNAFGTTTLLAVPIDQDLGGAIKVRLILIEKLDPELLVIGDKVVVYGKYGTDLNWVVEIVSIDFSQGIAEVTFDGVISDTVNIDDIEGLYVGNANILSIITYISSNLKGYIFLLGTYVVVFTVVYIFYIRKKEDKPIV